MKTREQVIEIVAGKTASYSSRIEALESIQDISIFKHLAENAEDDWIRLESAIRGGINSELIKLKNHPDERICLEASIELDDQKRLAEIILTSKDDLLKDIAVNYIDDDELLRGIISKCKNDKERVLAALRLGDIPLNKHLLLELKDEDLRLRLAQFLIDEKAISDLSENAKDQRVKKMASKWMAGLLIEDNDKIA